MLNSVESLPGAYKLTRSVRHDGYDLEIRHDGTHDLFYQCSIHGLPGTDIVYPVSPVLPLAPNHRQALPDIKLRMLEHILNHHRVILLSAGNETTGGRFSWQTQLQYLISHGYNAYQLTGTQISRFDDKALQAALAKPWTERLPLNEDYDIPVDLVHSLDELDARAALEG
ncbi:hypothetical protein [Pseudomonas sp. URMO17WK12:I11]|uniref:hypothetical protein n=1 Tax=Pseudomonas sp. URMO17WK12:I11 TaxID=1283291 RepID=UPI0011A804EC|nr:hypothetical protein [Pseudomonas sp. URMO17WK12:I11]